MLKDEIMKEKYKMLKKKYAILLNVIFYYFFFFYFVICIVFLNSKEHNKIIQNYDKSLEEITVL